MVVWRQWLTVNISFFIFPEEVRMATPRCCPFRVEVLIAS